MCARVSFDVLPHAIYPWISPTPDTLSYRTSVGFIFLLFLLLPSVSTGELYIFGRFVLSYIAVPLYVRTIYIYIYANVTHTHGPAGLFGPLLLRSFFYATTTTDTYMTLVCASYT